MAQSCAAQDAPFEALTSGYGAIPRSQVFSKSLWPVSRYLGIYGLHATRQLLSGERNALVDLESIILFAYAYLYTDKRTRKVCH